MIRILICIALAIGAWLTTPAPAHAAESYDNCTGFVSSLPATISTQGTWCLNQDLSTAMSTGSAITIATNNVTLDCNHFKIGGLAGGAGTTAYGVYASSRLNATVRNCSIRGFSLGINLDLGGGHLVADNRLDGNTTIGIRVRGPGSTIRNNIVIESGGSTYWTSYAGGIHAENGVDVLDNTVSGVAPTDTNAYADGIYATYNGDGSINGNRVRGLAWTNRGTPRGIFTIHSGRGVIRDNVVQGPGPSVAGGIGVYCSSNAATARDNVIIGFETGISICLSSSNVVNTN